MRIIVVAVASVAFPVIAGAADAPQSAPTAAAATATATAHVGSVARAQFSSAVSEREPVDRQTEVYNDQRQVYFFSELKDLAGARVTHRWQYQGEVMAEVSFDVGGPRWRVWSSKQLNPEWTGEWRVSVVDAAGATLATHAFMYREAAQDMPAQAEDMAAQPGDMPAQTEDMPAQPGDMDDMAAQPDATQ